MSFSLLRGLSAGLVRNLAGLKRDAKRLQKHSIEVFGTQYPLTTCQRAVAVQRGFKSLKDFEAMWTRLNMDRSTPFYTLRARSDAHEAVLNSLMALDLELSQSKPVVVLGEQKHAILPALTLFLEEQSARRNSGLILIETDANSRADTVMNDAIETLGVGGIVEDFRSLDLRDSALPVFIGTTARVWSELLAHALPEETGRRVDNTGWFDALELCAHANAISSRQLFGPKDFEIVPYRLIDQTACVIQNSGPWPSWMNREDADLSWRMQGIGAETPRLQPEDHDAVMGIISALRKRAFDSGLMVNSEAVWRPYVVVFSRKDPASEVLAGAVHSVFDQLGLADAKSRDRRPPVLYFSDGEPGYLPRFLRSRGHTAIVNGLAAFPADKAELENSGCSGALRAVASADGLQYMGARMPLA